MSSGKKSADIAIIGGGIIGCAIAFELARKKAGSILLVEKEILLGTGATAKCAGGIRAQFSSEVNSRVSQLAENIFMNFEDDFGVPATYEKVGYLFCVSTEEHEQAFRKQLSMWQGIGLPADWWSVDDISKRIPMLEVGDLRGGTFCSTDGIADPGEYMTGYEKLARQLGVTIRSGEPVTDVGIKGNRVKSITVGDEEIDVGIVINCTGPYAAGIGAMVGLDIPVQPFRRQICKTAPLDWLPHDLPMIVDVKSGLYMHRESGGILMGWGDPDVDVGFDMSNDPDYTDEIIMRALDRMPRLEVAEITHSWGGLYEVTPDYNAIVGPAEALAGFWNCTGFSGHGFMHAPAMGRLMAEWIVDGQPSIDLSALALERFAEPAKLKIEANVI